MGQQSTGGCSKESSAPRAIAGSGPNAGDGAASNGGRHNVLRKSSTRSTRNATRGRTGSVSVDRSSTRTDRREGLLDRLEGKCRTFQPDPSALSTPLPSGPRPERTGSRFRLDSNASSRIRYLTLTISTLRARPLRYLPSLASTLAAAASDTDRVDTLGSGVVVALETKPSPAECRVARYVATLS